MMQQLNVIFTGTVNGDDMALLLEVIAGEIRRGSQSGTENGFTWKIASPVTGAGDDFRNSPLH